MNLVPNSKIESQMKVKRSLFRHEMYESYPKWLERRQSHPLVVFPRTPNTPVPSDEEKLEVKTRFLAPMNLFPHIQLKVNSERVFVGLQEQLDEEAFLHESPFERFYDRPNCLVRTKEDFVITTNCWIPKEILCNEDNGTFVNVSKPAYPKYIPPTESKNP